MSWVSVEAFELVVVEELLDEVVELVPNNWPKTTRETITIKTHCHFLNRFASGVNSGLVMTIN